MNGFDDIPFTSDSASELPSKVTLNSSFDDIPFDNNIVPEVTDNNIIILDERIKDIPARNTKVSFKKPTIIFPIIAFVFVSILGMYLFVNNSRAESVNLIKIENNKKVGYIDNEGTIITRPKYLYGSDYYKGYAIVKNSNNLYGVLNGKGVLEVPFGNYYYIGLFGNKYIASKITNNGLKQALLDYDLKELTSFKYDSISYAKNGMYLFTRDETMGIINKQGKEIYSFKVDEVDDKDIDIEISNVDEDVPLSDRYAKVKVNNSSTIINLETGKEVYSYTLKDINVLKNNVFYIISDSVDENSTYIVVKDGEVKYKTDKFKRLRIDNIKSDIIIGVNNDTSVSYINMLTQKIINENNNNDYYYGDGIILEKSHDFNADKNIYNVISSKKILGTFSDYEPVNNKYYNDMLNVRLYKDKYNYVDKEGNIINSNSYDKTSEFNKSGYAIVGNDNNYGILSKKGKEIVKLSYDNLEFIDDDLFELLRDNYKKELFIYNDKNDNYGFINSKDKIEIEAIYDNIDYLTDDYPIVLASYSGDKLLVNLSTGKELPIKINSDNITVKSNYILVDDNYYNYSGKLIYSVE